MIVTGYPADLYVSREIKVTILPETVFSFKQHIY